MKLWRFRFSPEASRLLSRLHPDIKKIAKKTLTELRDHPYIGKDLQEELSGFKSLRFKQYRIIYDLDDNRRLIRIYYVGRRRDVYEQFRDLLSELRKPLL
jgi:mRNA interferase RelE/StbE